MKKEIMAFVIIVLAVSWIPMSISEPLPENTISKNQLERTVDLIPGIERYSLTLINRSTYNGSVILVAWIYLNKEVPTWVIVQKTEDSTPDNYPKMRHLDQNWLISNDRIIQLNGTNVQYFEAEKDGQKIAVLYWSINIGEKKFIYILQRSRVFITVTTPLDENAWLRLNDISQEIVKHYSRG